MSRQGAEVVVLCEDKQQAVFLRRLLKARGYFRIRVREDYPEGRGAATAYVIRRFPSEAGEQRASASHMRQGLAVAIDADDRTTDQRFADLWRGVARPRGTDEKIAVFIPKRNIETWIHYLLGRPDVNEQDTYPKLRDRERDCQPAVARFAGMAREPAPPDGCLPSLVRGLAEVRRLP